MRDSQSPAERYRRLARECLKVANTFPQDEQRDALLQMAQVWQRLADQYKDSTPAFSLSAAAAEQPAVQQQQQIQPDEDKKE
jgi:hypothetical protein